MVTTGVQTRAIDERDLTPILGDQTKQTMTSRLGLVGDDGHWLTDQRIQERRFTDVRAADQNGMTKAFCRSHDA